MSYQRATQPIARVKYHICTECDKSIQVQRASIQLDISTMPSREKEPHTLTHIRIHRVENLHVACWREGDLSSFVYGRLCFPPMYAHSQMAARNKTKNYVSAKRIGKKGTRHDAATL